MPIAFRASVVALLLCGDSIAFAQTPIPPAFRDSLGAVRKAVRPAQCGLEGDGGSALVQAVQSAQFAVIGEAHGIADVPRFTSALFCAAAKSGYRHLAIETGATVAEELERIVRSASPVDAVTRFATTHYPGAPFYVLREEAELLASAVRASGATSGVLWGIDYDVLVDRYAMTRLRALARTDAQRRVVDSVQAIADSMLRGALASQNPALVFGFSAPEQLVTRLRAAFPKDAGGEVERILATIERTNQINRFQLSGQGYDANLRRAENLRENFVAHYRAASSAERTPKVMIKLGGNHAFRGRNLTSTFDVGSLVPELAAANGTSSVGMLVLGGPTTLAANFDPKTLSYSPGQEPTAATAWAQQFLTAADSASWSVFDLRPLRSKVARGVFGVLPPPLVAVVYGFDYVVILGGSGPATPLVSSPPAALLGASRQR